MGGWSVKEGHPRAGDPDAEFDGKDLLRNAMGKVTRLRELVEAADEVSGNKYESQDEDTIQFILSQQPGTDKFSFAKSLARLVMDADPRVQMEALKVLAKLNGWVSDGDRKIMILMVPPKDGIAELVGVEDEPEGRSSPVA